MQRILFLLPTAILGGCILYDENPNCRGNADCELDSWTGGLADGSSGDTAAAPEATFSLTPNEAQAGETFIASLTAENFDLSAVGQVEVFGNATAVATQNRGDELVITFTVHADAQTGDVVDLLLNVGNDAVFVEAALTVVDSGIGDDDGGVDAGGDSGNCE